MCMCVHVWVGGCVYVNVCACVCVCVYVHVCVCVGVHVWVCTCVSVRGDPAYPRTEFDPSDMKQISEWSYKQVSSRH